MIREPPFVPGADQLTRADSTWESPASVGTGLSRTSAATPTGTPGIVSGVTDGAKPSDDPAPFDAITLNW